MFNVFFQGNTTNATGIAGDGEPINSAEVLPDEAT